MNNTDDNNSNKLFETINYKSQSDLRNLIENLSLEQAIFFLNTAIGYSYNKGVFSLVESEIISKSLSLINSKVFIPNESTGQGTDNI